MGNMHHGCQIARCSVAQHQLLSQVYVAGRVPALESCACRPKCSHTYLRNALLKRIMLNVLRIRKSA